MKFYNHPSDPSLFLVLGHDATTFGFSASAVSLGWGGECLVSIMPCAPRSPLWGLISGYKNTYSSLC